MSRLSAQIPASRDRQRVLGYRHLFAFYFQQVTFLREGFISVFWGANFLGCRDSGFQTACVFVDGSAKTAKFSGLSKATLPCRRLLHFLPLAKPYRAVGRHNRYKGLF
jgi:hypothetical protein